MKVPKFSGIITIPVLFILNFLAWLYIYDDYMTAWIYVYPIYIVIALAFTISAELIFGKSKKFKYIGINICIVLLLLVLTQRFIPMDKIEQGLKENYYSHIKADVPGINLEDKAIRSSGFSIVARNYQDNENTLNTVDKLEVYKDGSLIDEITLDKAIKKVEEIMTSDNKARFDNLAFHDIRYTGIKRKDGVLRLNFVKGHVFFKYNLLADEKGFIWKKEEYECSGLEMPRKDNLFDADTNKKFKKIILKGDLEQTISVKVGVKGDPPDALANLKNKGYQIIFEDPITLKIPFYEIANLAHEEYINTISIK